MRRGVANHIAQENTHRPLQFLLNRRDEHHNVTREVIETGQGDVAMVLASDGTALSPQDRQLQIARLNNLAAHPDLQAHRQRREQEDDARVDKLMRILPDAFLYQYDKTVPCTVSAPPYIPLPGEAPPPPSSAPPAECYHFTFVPNPKFAPPDTESRILRGMAGEVWMETSQERLVRLNAHLITDVDFGWGLIGRLYKGGTIFLEQTNIGGGDWELSRMQLNLTGKALMFKSLSFRLTEEMSRFSRVPPHLDYRKAIQMLESSAPGSR